MLLIEETNAAEYYDRTKFDLYKDDICLGFFYLMLPNPMLFIFLFEGDNVIQDTENGFVLQVPDQIQLACNIVKNDTRFRYLYLYPIGEKQQAFFSRLSFNI